MRKVREVLRLVLEQQRSQREVGQSVGLSQSTIHEYVSRFAASGLTWPLATDVDDGTLEARLFRRQALPAPTTRPVPEWVTVHRELKRKGVTLQPSGSNTNASSPTGISTRSSVGITTTGWPRSSRSCARSTWRASHVCRLRGAAGAPFVSS
jgi:transposase